MTPMPTSPFHTALEKWRNAALKMSVAEAAYAEAFGKAYAESTGRTEKHRECEAEMATRPEREARDLARIEERSAKWVVEYLMRHTEVAA